MDHRIEIWKLIVSARIVLDLTCDIISQNVSGQAGYSVDHRIEILKLIVSVGIVLDLTCDIISQKFIWPSGLLCGS